MKHALLTVLGKLAAFTRSMGFGLWLNMFRNVMDQLFKKSGRLPLKWRTDGFELSGFLRHRSFLASLYGGIYEPYSRRLFEDLLRPHMVVIDGGAHLGLYTLIASRNVGESGKIFAFEPDPHNFHALVFNLEKNRCTNVNSLQKALSCSIGRSRFYQCSGTISSSLINRDERDTIKLINVKTTTLDYELSKLEFESILIKLDIEGAEPLALQGMQSVLRKASTAVCFVEVNPSALQAAGFTPEDLIRNLFDMGFRLYFIDELKMRLLPVSKQKNFGKGNLLCTKGEYKIDSYGNMNG